MMDLRDAVRLYRLLLLDLTLDFDSPYREPLVGVQRSHKSHTFQTNDPTSPHVAISDTV